MARRTNPAVAANTAKARKMDVQEAMYVQFRGDCADIQRGRRLPFYDSDNCGRDADRQTEWAIRHTLTPCEEWAVRQGYIKNPFEEIWGRKAKSTDPVAGYTREGKRRIYRYLELAIADPTVIRVYSKGEYITVER